MWGYRFFALFFVICSLVLFFQFRDSQQRTESKLRSIRTGEVRPERLTVVSKEAGSKKSAAAWVTLRSDQVRKFVYASPRITPRDRQVYDGLNPGSTVTGYYFPEGYFIPQLEPEHDAGTARWVFLGGGLSIAALAFAISFLFQKKGQNGT